MNVHPIVDDNPEDTASAGAMAVLRQGAKATPELRDGLRASLWLALVVAAGRLVIPITIQQILDKGIVGEAGFRPTFVAVTAAVAAAAIIGLTVLNGVTYLRLMTNAERVLFGLRTRAFAHVHKLSIAHHSESKRGVLVARVTSDIETLAQFASWGAVSWVVNLTIITVTLAVMIAYAWQLAAVTVLVLVPVLPVMRLVQKRQLHAYDELRSRVGETLTEISESVMGARVLRAYGHVEPTRHKLHDAIDRQYRAQKRARFFFAIMFPISDVFAGFVLAAVVGVGVWWGPGWGIGPGTLVASLFLAALVLQPVAEIGEVLDQTQTAIAGWRKVLRLLDEPIEVVDPEPGVTLPRGELEVRIEGVTYGYDPARPVLTDVDLVFPAGTNVAIVGETGSGKTTLAKLLCRLADPTAGRILIGGVDLREAATPSRRTAVRMVPQDGFLFDTTVGENVRMGRPDATDEEIRAAFTALDLDWWLTGLPTGLETPVGERGDALSVGERQLLALVRAELADPGLLILDEATSAVDPETERALAQAMAKLAAGRTVVSIAHRLSTAEAADLVVVVDAGRVVEVGPHEELVRGAGVYARLHESWIGNTRAS